MRYRELRDLERLLVRYYTTRRYDSALLPAIDRLRAEVTKAAGKAQRAEPRMCGWCKNHHTDTHPDLCDGCRGVTS